MSNSLLKIDQHDAEEASDESFSDEAPLQQPPVWRRRKFVKGAGLSLVVAAVLGTVCMMIRGDPESPNSARHLMHSQEFRHAVRERVLLSANSQGHRLSPEDVDKEIAQDLDAVFTYVDKNYPEISEKLKHGDLRKDQSSALIDLVARQHDKRLKELGEKTIKVVLKNVLFGPKAVRERLIEEFRPQMPQLMALYKDVVPPPIREAKAKWYKDMHKKKVAQAEENALSGALEFLLHPRAISIMKTFGNPAEQANQTSAVANRQLTAPAPTPAPPSALDKLEAPTASKLGVGITGFALNSVNLLVMELSQLLEFTMPWWGWLLTLLPGVSLGTTSCIIAPITKSYADFWCLDFLMFTGIQALEVLVAGAYTFVQDD